MEKPLQYKYKGYAHFDRKVKIDDVKSYVENPKKVAKHGFYPFIHFTNKMIKYSSADGRKEKPRELCYAAHLDRYIYQLYSYKLNILYNKRARADGTNNCAIAYRNDKSRSNIHFAKEVFDFIRKVGDAYIIVGDFTHFFDNLDHKYLKERLCDLLNQEQLPDDYYAVYKNITKFSKFELSDILKLNGGIRYKELNRKDVALTIEELRRYKKQYLFVNRKDFGIPQGAAISSVLSNIYMMNFDKKINDFVTSNKGLYRRYCDDFIIVLSICEGDKLKELWKTIDNYIKLTKNIELQPSKTKVFQSNGNKIINCNNILFPGLSKSKNELEYLGFSFNGKKVSIRGKTVSKYYYRMYRKIDSITKQQKRTGIKVPKYNLYKKYSHLGARTKKKSEGNFLTYVNRCEDIFGKNENVNMVKKRHWKKLNERLK